ncbi:Cupredoxin, partial [Gymnopilus junonius]
LLLPALAAAQVYGPVGPPSGTTAAAAAAAAAAPSAPPSNSSQINIDVAAGGSFVFNPSNITAAVGTLVTFYFPGGSTPHSVTQSSFDNPCTYLASTSNSSGGFDSGLVGTGSTFTINVTDTNPIWFHCKSVSPTHCPGFGMVGSINAPSSGDTFAAFQAKAMSSNAPTETDNGPVTGGVGAVATSGPVSDTGSSSSGSSSDATKVVASVSLALLSATIAV